MMSQHHHHQTSYIGTAKNRYPNLRNLNNLRNFHRECYVTVIELDFDGHLLTKSIYHTVSELQQHFQTRKKKHKTGQKMIYLMEDLQDDFIETVASFFELSPFIFGTQIRSQLWENNPSVNNTPNLLSSREIDGIFTLWYFEPFELDRSSRYDAKCNIGRHCTLSKLKRFETMRLVRHRASFWSRQDADGGWDGFPLYNAFRTNKTSLDVA